MEGRKTGFQTPEYESNSEADDVIHPRKARKTNSRATNVSFTFEFNCRTQSCRCTSSISAWERLAEECGMQEGAGNDYLKCFDPLPDGSPWVSFGAGAAHIPVDI